MTEPAQTLREFSFSDGVYLCHFSEGHTCVMEYRDWQERLFRFVFDGVAMLRSYGGGVSLCESRISTESELITECRRVLADDWGTSGGPQGIALTELTIFDDVPVFSIVFTSVRVIGPIGESERMAVVP